MRIKEIYQLNGHVMLTLDMDEREFLEFRDTMKTIDNENYGIMDMRPAMPVMDTVAIDGRNYVYYHRGKGCAYTVRIHDRIDESIEAYTAGCYLAGKMTDAEANMMLDWRNNAESIRIENTGV